MSSLSLIIWHTIGNTELNGLTRTPSSIKVLWSCQYWRGGGVRLLSFLMQRSQVRRTACNRFNTRSSITSYMNGSRTANACSSHLQQPARDTATKGAVTATTAATIAIKSFSYWHGSSGAGHCCYSCCCCYNCNCSCSHKSNHCRISSVNTNWKYNTIRHFARTYHKSKSAMDVPDGLFQGNIDRFDGVIVKSKDEYDANVDFQRKLKESLAFWHANERRTIWFCVQTEHSDWVPHLAKNGFAFHHVQNDAVVMYRWLPETESANIPNYCHTMLGTGGLVINEKNEILVIKERHALIKDSWKLPGGYVEPGESLVVGAIREVLEETGIKCQFETVVSIRHSLGATFGSSDMYIVMALKPENSNLQRCEREIADLRWMPVDEYLEHPNVHETNRHNVRIYFDYKKRGVRFTCEKRKHQVLKKDYWLYYMKAIDDDCTCN